MKFFISIGFISLFPLVSRAQYTSKCTSLEVRKEWRALTKVERKAWIDANNCLNKKPSNGKLNLEVDTNQYDDPFFYTPHYNNSGSYYDDLVYVHMNLNSVIHFTGQFLPWHRVYLLEWTNALRKECGYKGVVPYWAWEKDTVDFEGSEIWDTDPNSGLGGFSDNSSDDYTIHDGALDIYLAYPTPHKLRRRYVPYPYDNARANYSKVKATDTFTPAEVRKLLAQPEGNFTKFQSYLERPIGMHSSIHGMLGGDMGTMCPAGTEGTESCPVQGAATFSANDVTFHLHHGNVDRLWWLWQEKSDKNKYAFHGGSVQNTSALDQYPNGQPPWLDKSARIPNDGMWKNYTIGDTLDTRRWPFCYVYE